MTPKDAMYLNVIEGRLAALEVVMIALVRTQPSTEFKRNYFEAKEEAIAMLLANHTVSDGMHNALERRLQSLEEWLCIKADQPWED